MTAYFSAAHSSEYVGVETSPVGQQVLCTCGDGAVELLNLATQQHLPVSRAHPACVLNASISGMCFASLPTVLHLLGFTRRDDLYTPPF